MSPRRLDPGPTGSTHQGDCHPGIANIPSPHPVLALRVLDARAVGTGLPSWRYCWRRMEAFKRVRKPCNDRVQQLGRQQFLPPVSAERGCSSPGSWAAEGPEGQQVSSAASSGCALCNEMSPQHPLEHPETPLAAPTEPHCCISLPPGTLTPADPALSPPERFSMSCRFSILHQALCDEPGWLPPG